MFHRNLIIIRYVLTMRAALVLTFNFKCELVLEVLKSTDLKTIGIY